LRSSRRLIIRLCGLRESFEEGTGTRLVKEAEGASKEERKKDAVRFGRSFQGLNRLETFFSLVSKIHSWSRIFLPSGLCFGAHSSAFFFFSLQFTPLDAGSRPGGSPRKWVM